MLPPSSRIHFCTIFAGVPKQTIDVKNFMHAEIRVITRKHNKSSSIISCTYIIKTPIASKSTATLAEFYYNVI